MMGEKFVKYQGLGNDFVILDRRAGGDDISAEAAVALCDRHFGIGADGVLCLLPATDADVAMIVHNADGSLAQTCGNGLRCVAHFLGLPSVSIRTGATVARCTTADGGDVEVEMGRVARENGDLPHGGPFIDKALDDVRVSALSMGNPHCVVLGEWPRPPEQLGPALERHSLFPHRTNVEFPKVRPDGTIELRVWERGVGFTLACGSGAVATVAALGLQGLIPLGVWRTVHLPGGILRVRVSADFTKSAIAGPARAVFEGWLPEAP